MRRNLLIVLALAVLTAGWFAWRWYTAPALPSFPLERMERPVAELIATAQEEVRLVPRSGEAWGKLAMIAAVNGYPEQALLCLIQAERLDRDDPRWPYLHAISLLREQPDTALPLLQRALELAATKAQVAAIRFRLVLMMAEHGQLDEAEQHLQALRGVEANSARVQFGAALLADARNDRKAARQHLETLLASPFARRQAHARLAAVALADGNDESARRYQERLGRLPADLPWPDLFLDEMNPYAVGRQNRFIEAESLEARGRLHESVALLRRIAAETPDVRSNLALGLGLGKLEAYDEAESVLRAVIDMDPHNLQANHFLGTVLFLRGEKLWNTPNGQEQARAVFREAVATQDRALAIKADHAMAHLTRGRALAYLGESEAAVRALREAVRCRPEIADTHLYLGETLADMGRLPEAVSHLEDAVRYARPDDPRPRAALAKWQRNAK
jgi:tetratricopeptide (TPR) repeat protein